MQNIVNSKQKDKRNVCSLHRHHFIYYLRGSQQKQQESRGFGEPGGGGGGILRGWVESDACTHIYFFFSFFFAFHSLFTLNQYMGM
jgi:hypothetical protein